jgi:beta-N-acetylhexosaminidase
MTQIISILIVLVISLLFPTPLHHVDITLEPEPIVQEPPPPTPEELMLKDMSIEEKVGQLFIFGFDGTTLNKETREFFENYKIGGILLLGKNISSETQIKGLIEDIQTTNNIPLFITIDQEGGEVARIRWDSKLTKSQTLINTPQEAYEDALYRGTYLKSIGINMNFAPVVEYITDKNSFIYNRAYRGTQEEVYLKSISAIEGYTESRVISVPKHYPGHSNTSVDSHYNLPVVKINNGQWNEYIKPFTDVLSNTTVDAMMVGHVQFPNIDNQYPATLSSEIINKRLIEDLQYEGLVISDDMEMGALDDLGTYEEIAKRALEAGNDMLIYSKYTNRHPNLQKDVYEYILEEVKDGKMNIDDKVLKILKIKTQYDILNIQDY